MTGQDKTNGKGEGKSEKKQTRDTTLSTGRGRTGQDNRGH